MPFVVYTAPYFTPNAVRFIEALVSFYNIRLAIISQESIEKLPDWQRARVHTSRQMKDVMQTGALIKTMEDIQNQKGQKIDKILGATEQLQVPMAEARAHLRIEGMDVETALNFRDKSRMKKIFEKKGIPCARHTLAVDLNEALQFRETCPYPYVVKPVTGAGSQATFRVSNDEEMRHAFHEIGWDVKHGVIIEEFVKGKEFSLDTFSKDGKILGQTINSYHPTPLEVMRNPWMQWRVMLGKECTGPAFADIRKAGKKVLDALGMKTGMSHMEWFRRDDGSIAISEVAARPPGAQFTTLISRACDFDAVRAWVELMVFGDSKIPPISYTSGAAYLRGDGGSHVSHVEGMELMRSRYNDMITDIRIPQKGQPKSLSYEGEGFVIVRHADTRVVEDALKDIVANVRVMMH